MGAAPDRTAEAASMPGGFPWLESRLDCAPGVRRLRVGERAVLFCERRQQLFELNATADAIWRSLVAGHPPSTSVQALRALGASDAEALTFVTDSAQAWLEVGLLLPAEVTAWRRQAPETELHLRIGDLACSIAIHGPEDDPMRRELVSVFAQFFAEPSEGAMRISLCRATGGAFLLLAGAPLGLIAEASVVPEVKAVLTEAISRSLGEGAFLLHAALLARRRRGLLIAGGPGAGKTTLAVALAAGGFGYGSDDIVTVSPAGGFTGIPFSPALKSGGWGLAAVYAPQVASLPIHVRGDGQCVRFMPLEGFGNGDVDALGWALVLDRREGAQPALEPLEPLDMLGVLIAGAYCHDHLMRAASLEAFAAAFSGVDCRRLVYSDLAPAVALVNETVGE